MARTPSEDPSQSSQRPTFGELLQRYRLARRLSPAELASRVGLSARGINDLERGARGAPRRETVALLAGALELGPEEREALLSAVRRAPRTPVTPITLSEHVLSAISSSRHSLLPTGTVTFLFTDIEHSTQLLERLGDRYVEALDAMRDILRVAFKAHAGQEVDTQGDSFFAAFHTAHDALAAAAQAQRALAAHDWPEGDTLRVRMGLHTGTPLLVANHYIGFDVHRAARIGAAAHGGQILLSTATAELARGARDGLPEGTDLRDLGAHRLKDLRAPERLWQLVIPDLAADFPAPRSLDRHTHNLPIQPTQLLGRTREIAEVTRLFFDGAWLVTVTGPPGVGKTHLSLQVAAELTGQHDLFPDGVWFVRLSRVTDPTLVVPTLAHELGVRAHGARPVAEVLYDYLESRRALLVLDNFEHVAAAAGDLAELRQHCPGVRLLVTSRAPLRLRGEREYALAALPVPATDGPPVTPEHLAPFASIRLFSERAQAAVSDFAITLSTAPVVAEICSRLDGLPLALELAAARVKFLPLDALLTRLERSLPLLSNGPRDADEHHQTMRATISWSEELLSEEERALFRRMAVFANGATLNMVEEVCLVPEGAPPLELDALSGLAALMDQSLVQRREERGDQRYVMLHVVREYALERLEASGEAEALRRAHALACLRLCERYGPLDAFGHPDWIARMSGDSHNLRAALAWALERHEAELGLRLVIGAAQYWYVRGDAAETYRWLTRTLQMDSDTPSPASDAARDTKRAWARRWAIEWAVDFATMRVVDHEQAEAWLNELLDRARAAGDRALEAMGIWALGQAAIYQRQASDEALPLLRQAIAVARESGDEAVQNCLFSWIGFDLISCDASVIAEATAIGEEGVRLARKRGNVYFEFMAYGSLAYLAMRSDDMERARAAMSRALEVIAAAHYEASSEALLGGLADMAAHEGRSRRAARLAGAQRIVEESLGMTYGDILDMPTVAQAYAALGPQEWDAQYAIGRAMSREETLAEAWREARGEPE